MAQLVLSSRYNRVIFHVMATAGVMGMGMKVRSRASGRTLRHSSVQEQTAACYHKDSTRVRASWMSRYDETCNKEKVQYQSWGGIVTASNSNDN